MEGAGTISLTSSRKRRAGPASLSYGGGGGGDGGGGGEEDGGGAAQVYRGISIEGREDGGGGGQSIPPVDFDASAFDFGGGDGAAADGDKEADKHAFEGGEGKRREAVEGGGGWRSDHPNPYSYPQQQQPLQQQAQDGRGMAAGGGQGGFTNPPSNFLQSLSGPLTSHTPQHPHPPQPLPPQAHYTQHGNNLGGIFPPAPATVGGAAATGGGGAAATAGGATANTATGLTGGSGEEMLTIMGIPLSGFGDLSAFSSQPFGDPFHIGGGGGMGMGMGMGRGDESNSFFPHPAPPKAPSQAQGRGSNKYKGVNLNEGNWRAVIYENGRQIYLGSPDCEEEGARLYDSACYYMRGAKAKLNFPNEIPRPLSEELKVRWFS